MIRIRHGDAGFEVETVWREDVLDSRTAVVHDGSLYGFHGAFLQAVAVADGRERWRARGFSRGSLIAAGDRLVVLGERGRLALVEPAPEGYRELAGTNVLDGRTWTSPSLAGGRLYLRGPKEIVAIDLSPVSPVRDAPPVRRPAAVR